MGFGIYIHIPFCKQKCFYCDFASTAKKVDETLYEQYINAELARKQYLKYNKDHLTSYPILPILSFDLKDKEFFYYHGAAIKNNKLYGGSQEYSAAEYYKRALDIELTSALLNHHINIEDIKDSNYQITRSTDHSSIKNY